jgi:hypothetical protein
MSVGDPPCKDNKEHTFMDVPSLQRKEFKGTPSVNRRDTATTSIELEILSSIRTSKEIFKGMPTFEE